MGRYKSRATRCSEACADLQNAAEGLREVAEQLRENYPEDEPAYTALVQRLDTAEQKFEDGKSDIEELKGEIESWKDNMEGANMEHLPKFEEVSSCYDQCEAATDLLDGITIPTIKTFDEREQQDPEDFADELDSVAGEIDDAVSEAEAADFPGMYS